MDKETKIKHESFGMIQLCHFSGGGQTYFGSAIPHDRGVSLKIYEGEWKRNLNSDWYSPRKRIIEVRMTENQFAEAIANMNSSPVPVTIERVLDKKMEAPPIVNKREQFEDELKSQMEALAEKVSQITKETTKLFEEKKSFTKEERNKVISSLRAVEMEIASNFPFIETSFREAMDKVVLESKVEAEGFLRQRAQALGIDLTKKIEGFPIKELE